MITYKPFAMLANFLGDLSGLPPTLSILAEFDPLKDDGEKYHKKLLANGVDSHLKILRSIHGFVSVRGIILELLEF